ncbi:MAG: transglycosylase domain-containing protein [Patescibacteria group bacterium]
MNTVFEIIYRIITLFYQLGAAILFPGVLLTQGIALLAHFVNSVASKLRQIAIRLSKKVARGIIALRQNITKIITRAQKVTTTRIKKIRNNLSRTAKKIQKTARFKPIKLTVPATRATSIGVIAGLITTATVAAGHYSNQLPNPSSLQDFNTPAATLIYDRNGVLLYSAYTDTYRVPVSLSDIPPVLIEATLEAEDARFYQHHGIDLQAVARAALNNLQNKPTQGASTITQQLARTAFLNRERTWTRKIDEAIIAAKIEQNFEKHQILELYFNTVPYGGVAIGVEAAAKHYFHKSVQDLSASEALFLASLTPAPSVFSQSAQEHPDDYQRVTQLAEKMLISGKITDKEYQAVQTAELHFAPRVSYKRAPHAVDQILTELVARYGESELLDSGVIVHSTIDLQLQNTIQQQVLSEVVRNGAVYNFSNAAVVIADPNTGQIQALIGSANYYDPNSGQVNVAAAQRQLGSTLKIIPYAAALEQGMKPDSTIVDEATVFTEYQNYTPRNYDGTFHGTVTLAEALGNSYNIPAIKLTHQIGPQVIAEYGTKFGLTEYADLNQPIPLSLAIGGVETSLLNLTQAYQVLAEAGEKKNLHLINQITNHHGNKIYQAKSQGEQVVTASTAQTLSEMLADPAARLAMFGRPALFEFGDAPVSIKTGTSNEFKDNVAVAFTEDFVVAVWTGNNSGEPMAAISSGYTGATPIMHSTTSHLLERQPTRFVSSN